MVGNGAFSTESRIKTTPRSTEARWTMRIAAATMTIVSVILVVAASSDAAVDPESRTASEQEDRSTAVTGQSDLASYGPRTTCERRIPDAWCRRHRRHKPAPQQ